MMWVLGSLGLLFGFCLGAAVFVLPMDAVANQARTTLSPAQLSQLGNVDLGRLMKIVYTVVSGILIGVSLVLLVLGLFVRRGGRASIITGLVVFIGLGLLAVISVLGQTVQAIMGSPTMILGAAVWLVLGAAFGLTIAWLGQALRFRGPAMPQAYYAQLQQQSMGVPRGYGYGYAAPTQGPPSPQQILGSVPPPPEGGPPQR
jgi:hypothetical protein